MNRRESSKHKEDDDVNVALDKYVKTRHDMRERDNFDDLSNFLE